MNLITFSFADFGTGIFTVTFLITSSKFKMASLLQGYLSFTTHPDFVLSTDAL
jgi:hypothetical protein